MDPDWTGPYTIHEVLPKGTFRLCDPSNPSQVMSQIYNISHLKLYFPRSVQESLSNKQMNSEPSQLPALSSSSTVSACHGLQYSSKVLHSASNTAYAIQLGDRSSYADEESAELVKKKKQISLSLTSNQNKRSRGSKYVFEDTNKPKRARCVSNV